MANDKGTTGIIASVILLFLLLIFHYYRSSIQQQVYERQGCKMTTWEIMLGSKPIERSFIDERKK